MIRKGWTDRARVVTTLAVFAVGPVSSWVWGVPFTFRMVATTFLVVFAIWYFRDNTGSVAGDR